MAQRWLVGHPRFVVSGLILLAALVRAWDLDSMSLWQDEGLSLYRATKDARFILSGRIVIGDLTTQDVQPPLYFLLLAGWFRLLGVSTWIGKYLSLLASLPAVPLLWALGRRWAGRPAALLTALLGAVSPVYLWYSQELRSYTLLVTLGLAAVYTLERALCASSNRGRLKWALASTVANAALAWTHYLGLFVIAFEMLWVAYRSRRIRSWRVIAPLAAAGLAILPLLPFAVRRVGIGPETDQHFVPLTQILKDIAYGFSFGWTGPAGDLAYYSYIGTVSLMCAAGALWLWRSRRELALAVLGYLLVPVVVLYLVTLLKPVYMGVRHILTASPPFYLLVACGVLALSRWRTWVGWIAAGAVIGAMAYSVWAFYAVPSKSKDDLEGLAEYVADRAVAGDVLAVSDPRLKLVFEHLMSRELGSDIEVLAIPDYTAWGTLDDSHPSELLGPLLERGSRVWFMTPHDEHRKWLEAAGEEGRPLNALHVDEETFHGLDIPVQVDAYERPPAPELYEPVEDGGLSLGGLRLLGWRAEPAPLVTGGAGRIWLAWRPEEVTTDYKVVAHLLDALRRNHGDGDHAPFHGLAGTADWPANEITYEPHDLLVSPGAPPGRYLLAVSAYDPDTGAVFPSDGPAALGELEVRAGTSVPTRSVEVGEPTTMHGGGFDVLGFDLPNRSFAAGDRLVVPIWLRVAQPPVVAAAVRLELATSRGRVIRTERAAINALAQAGRATPPSEGGRDVGGQGGAGWRVGDLRLVPVALDLPPEAGRFSLRLVLESAEGEPLRLWRGPLPVVRGWLAWIRTESGERTWSVPPMKARLEARFGETIELMGYDREGTLAPSKPMTVTLYWRALDRQPARYKATVQLLPLAENGPRDEASPGGPPVAQHDGEPADGARPTTGWLPGELVSDAHSLVLPELVPGRYMLIAALYDPSAPDMARVPVTSEESGRDYVLLEVMEVSEDG